MCFRLREHVSDRPTESVSQQTWAPLSHQRRQARYPLLHLRIENTSRQSAIRDVALGQRCRRGRIERMSLTQLDRTQDGRLCRCCQDALRSRESYKALSTASPISRVPTRWQPSCQMSPVRTPLCNTALWLFRSVRPARAGQTGNTFALLPDSSQIGGFLRINRRTNFAALRPPGRSEDPRSLRDTSARGGECQKLLPVRCFQPRLTMVRKAKNCWKVSTNEICG